MASKDWIKSKDAELVTQAQDFSAKITATPTAYGFTMAEASTLDGEVTAYVNAYNAATDPATRTRVTIQAKDTARATLVARMRNYGQRVQYNPSVTDAQKLELGLNLRDLEPTPIPPPATQPGAARDADVRSSDRHRGAGWRPDHRR